MGTLFDQDDEDSIAARFAKFHTQHPEVYALYKKFAYQLLHSGCRRGSTQQILGRVRWESALNPEHDGGFKVNEVFKKHYAKMLVADDPVFAGFFEFRDGYQRSGESREPGAA